MRIERKKIAILAAWTVEYDKTGFFIPSVHYAYLKYMAELFEVVYLISSHKETEKSSGLSRICVNNIKYIPISYFKGYVSAQLKINEYRKAINEVKFKVDLFYCRVPDPFSWMPSLLTNLPVIMHFVGDTIDATMYNENWSYFKKKIMIAGYYPDYLLTLRAAKKCCVYTNGFHLAEKLKSFGIKANPVISSTINKSLMVNNFNDLSLGKIKLIYIGYLRYAKGINTLKKVILGLYAKKVKFTFDIIGSGEMYEDLSAFIKKNDFDGRVIMHGHVDDRVKLNNLLRSADMFFFPSLSEGSPRVVIEAMSQGVPVLSTPVGSVPFVFKDKFDIRIFPFNDCTAAISIIEDFIRNNDSFDTQRINAFNKIKENYTIESFISKICRYDA